VGTPWSLRLAWFASNHHRHHHHHQGGSLYGLLVTGAIARTLHDKKFPAIFAPPLVIGGFALAFLYDMAYGSKMIRVRNEAAWIYENERFRFIPPSFTPFAQFWEDEAALFAKTHSNANKRVGW
jgi:hypothetical protein